MELYTPAEVAAVLKVSEDTIIRRFGDRPGVIDLGSPELVGRRKGKRRYRLLRIPQNVLDRFLTECQM